MTTTDTRPAQRKRRSGRTALIVVAAVVVGLVVGLIVAGLTRGHQEATTSPPPLASIPVAGSTAVMPSTVSSSPATSNAVDNVSGSLADGCLGGADPFAAVLAAQKAAEPSDKGAAGFARTVARWAATYPSDPSMKEVLEKIQAPGSAFAKTALLQTQNADDALRSQGYSSAQVSPGLGQYRVLSGVTAGVSGSDVRAVIQVQLYRSLTNGSGQAAQSTLTTELVLRFVANSWKVVGSPPNQEDPSSTTIAWQSYAGAC